MRAHGDMQAGRASSRRCTGFLWSGTFLLSLLLWTALPAAARVVVYSNNFEEPADALSEWSHTSTDTTPVGTRRFLGQFDNHTVSLTLTDLPPHSSVRVSFDLFIISSWDGNSTEAGPDIWDLSVGDGPTLLHTTFQHATDDPERRQAYPDPYPGGDHPPQTGAAEINTLGYTFFGDSVYQLSFTFPHSASSLVLNFSGSGLEGIGNESWGLDTVRVSVAGLPIFVTTTQDSGPGSLRQALLDANAREESPAAIAFQIPRTDPGFDGHVFTIQPTTPLPAVRQRTFIDGTSQTAFSGDSNPQGPEVVLNGSLVDRGHGLVLRGDRSAVIGLVLNGFIHGAGLSIQPSPTGDRTPSRHQLLQNYIGTDPTGTLAVPNARGIAIDGARSPRAQAQANVVEDNLIAGNLEVGVCLCEAADTRLTTNRIGTDRTGIVPLGNGRDGILLACAGAPRTLISGNTIAFNGGYGIRLAPDYGAAVALTPDGHQGTTIRHNALFANAARGIHLVPPPNGPGDGVTPNDPCDGDEGANHLQNVPDLLLAASDGQSTTISGRLNSTPNQPFTLDLYASDEADPSGFGEGQRVVDTVTVDTDASCLAHFTLVLPVGLQDQALTATATDAAGNTSEFSRAVAVVETTRSCQGGGSFVLAGRVTTAEDGQGLGEVAVELFREDDSCQAQTMTNSKGKYQVPNLGGGTYLVIPHHPTCRFEPTGWRVGLFGGNATLPFTAHCSE